MLAGKLHCFAVRLLLLLFFSLHNHLQTKDVFCCNFIDCTPYIAAVERLNILFARFDIRS